MTVKAASPVEQAAPWRGHKRNRHPGHQTFAIPVCPILTNAGLRLWRQLGKRFTGTLAMGTTSATLHIALPYGKSPDQSEALLKAYARLGWAPPKQGEAATRSVRLARNATPFVSIHDSACEDLDDGTLKQLAALVSKELKTAAIVATVHDSDVFEFLLYFEGQQVDAITDSADGLDAGVKSLSGKRQGNKWLEALGRAWALNLAGGPRPTSAAGVDAFVARAKAIGQMKTAFSEQKLEVWCELAGLPAAAASARGADRESDGDVVARLDLAPSATGPKARVSKAAAEKSATPAGRTLIYEHSPDDHPYHGYFPAAWPMPPASNQGFSWGVSCRDGGIDKFAFRVEIDRDGAFSLSELSVVARPFHNGQITSERVVAAAEKTFSKPEATEAATFILDAPDFHVPPPAEGSRSQALLLLKARVQAGWQGEFTLKPTLVADGVELALPPLRVAVTVPDWNPRIVEGVKLDVLRLVRVLRLNRPSVHSAVAILPGDDARTWDWARSLIEAALPPPNGKNTLVALDTQKHLSPSFKVPKSHAELALDGVTRAPAWTKLFDPAQDFQTVRIGLTRVGAPWPYAGFSVQTTLRSGLRKQALDAGSDSPATAIALWAIADPKARDALGVDWTSVAATFRHFLREAGALQAWLADGAWIPEFDTYEDFHQTLYENISLVDWFRSGRQGSCAGQLWSRRRLRFVSHRLWLGVDLAAAVDRTALAEVADVVPVREGFEVALKPGVELRALEQALWPILPLAP
jgi:hypothetical protein